MESVTLNKLNLNDCVSIENQNARHRVSIAYEKCSPQSFKICVHTDFGGITKKYPITVKDGDLIPESIYGFVGIDKKPKFFCVAICDLNTDMVEDGFYVTVGFSEADPTKNNNS